MRVESRNKGRERSIFLVWRSTTVSEHNLSSKPLNIEKKLQFCGYQERILGSVEQMS